MTSALPSAFAHADVVPSPILQVTPEKSRVDWNDRNEPSPEMRARTFAELPLPVVFVTCVNEFAGASNFALLCHKKISPLPSALSQFVHTGFGCVAPAGVKPLPRSPASKVEAPASAAFDVKAMSLPDASIVAFW